MKNIALIASLLLTTVVAPDLSAQSFERPGIDPLPTTLVMELRVAIGTPVSTGESDLGTRRYIPITGGEFEGRGIRGEVLPGGADWQLVRADGITEIKAVYAIRTDDGAVIWVDNQGVVDPDADPRYVRTRPMFRAPSGPYEWLNRRLFVGTITPQAGAVIIRVFQVD